MSQVLRLTWAGAALLAILLIPQQVAAANEAEVLVGDVLVGVDPLGRVLIAVDQLPADGLADQCFLFTSAERLEGPWSERFDLARVTVSEGSLTIKNAPATHAISLAVIGSDPLPLGVPPHAVSLSHHDGLELSKMRAGPLGGGSMNSMSILDLSTWPEAFWYDLLAPESGPCPDDSDCIAGGQGSTSCSLTISTSCSVTCTGDNYACCKETPLGGVLCRCRPCITGA